jgi:hypothetical protein
MGFFRHRPRQGDDAIHGLDFDIIPDACRGTPVNNKATTPAIRATRIIAFIELSPFMVGF